MHTPLVRTEQQLLTVGCQPLGTACAQQLQLPAWEQGTRHPTHATMSNVLASLRITQMVLACCNWLKASGRQIVNLNVMRELLGTLCAPRPPLLTPWSSAGVEWA
jgi:hypothetical protein